MKKRIIGFLIESIYFLIVIVGISSSGVWLPIMKDYAEYDQLEWKTMDNLAWGLVIYSIAIVAVAYIDRILQLLKNTNRYHRNGLEFLTLLLFIGVNILLVYLCWTNEKFGRIGESFYCALILTIISWLFWIYVRHKTPTYDNYSALGGQMD